MARSIKKGPYVQDALMTKVSAMNSRNEKRVIKTWGRASTIVPDFVGHTFAVHNGNKFIPVNEALGLLKFSKKHAAKQIEKVLNSAVANAEFKSREGSESVDVDTLYISHAIVNEGPALRRFMPAAQGRATPIRKRTSHVEIVLDAREEKPRVSRPARETAGSTGKPSRTSGSKK